MKSLLIKSCLLLITGITIAQPSDPKKSKEYFNKGQQLFAHVKYKEAIEAYTLAIMEDSSNTNAWIRRGFTKGMIKDFSGEMADYTKVIEMDRQHKWAYISRGSALNRLGDYTNAINDFNKALLIDPKEPEAYNNRGFAKKMSGDKEGACNDWNISKKLGNGEAKIILKNNHCR